MSCFVEFASIWLALDSLLFRLGWAWMRMVWVIGGWLDERLGWVLIGGCKFRLGKSFFRVRLPLIYHSKITYHCIFIVSLGTFAVTHSAVEADVEAAFTYSAEPLSRFSMKVYGVRDIPGRLPLRANCHPLNFSTPTCSC